VTYLLDTHVLLWVSQNSPKLTPGMRSAIENPSSTTYFSVASMWEIVIKSALGRAGFRVDVDKLRSRALLAKYEELPVRGHHVLAVAALPPIHQDPFDRILLAQARAEEMELLTADGVVLSYGAPAVNL